MTEPDDGRAGGGAVDLAACPRSRMRLLCRCRPCAVCGYGEHTAVHGPVLGQPPGSAPWGHQYVPERAE